MSYQKYVYVGCRTTKKRHAIGKGISIYGVNEQRQWDLIDIYEGLDNPSFITLDNNKEYLYCVHGDFNRVTAFKIKDDGKLTRLNSITIEGINPVTIIPSPDNRYLLVPFLGSGHVIAIERNVETGKLICEASSIIIPGIGSGDFSHPHQVCFDKSGKRIFVPCQARAAGFSEIAVIDFNPDNGKLNLKYTRETRYRAEGRHIVIHPNGKFVYMVSEGDSTITLYYYDQVKGVVVPVQVVSTIPDTITGDCWASGVAISSDGKFIYVSNRTDDSVTSFKIDQQTGMLIIIGRVSCMGVHPRFITLGPCGRHLYIANKNSHTIYRYTCKDDGTLTDPQLMAKTGSPTCVAFSW